MNDLHVVFCVLKSFITAYTCEKSPRFFPVFLPGFLPTILLVTVVYTIRYGVKIEMKTCEKLSGPSTVKDWLVNGLRLDAPRHTHVSTLEENVPTIMQPQMQCRLDNHAMQETIIKRQSVILCWHKGNEFTGNPGSFTTIRKKITRIKIQTFLSDTV